MPALHRHLVAVSVSARPSQKEFSENENRYLTKFPSFTAKALLDGAYTEALGDWLADHFPQRDFFVGFKSGAEITCGRKEINHIYVAEDDYLIESYAKPQNTERITDTLVSFYDKVDTSKVDVNLMLVPTAVTVYSDKLPAHAPCPTRQARQPPSTRRPGSLRSTARTGSSTAHHRDSCTTAPTITGQHWVRTSDISRTATPKYDTRVT